MQYYLSLLGFAAIDSLNLLAFAVIAGLWLTSAGRGIAFAPRAARFTGGAFCGICLLYTSPSPRDGLLSRMPSSA